MKCGERGQVRRAYPTDIATLGAIFAMSIRHSGILVEWSKCVEVISVMAHRTNLALRIRRFYALTVLLLVFV